MSKSDKSLFPEIYETSSLLLVEGPDDKEVIGAIMHCNAIKPGFAVSVEEGIKNLKLSFSSRLKNTNVLNKLWVIMDADGDCNAKWQMLRDCMICNGSYDITCKTPLPRSGAVFYPSDDTGVTVGVWIMPDNENTGMVEDFIAQLVKTDDTLIDHAVSTVKNLDGDREKHPALFRQVHMSKAVIHTWLAWQDKPGNSLGTAILKRKIDFSASLFTDFIAWIKKLQPEASVQ